MPLSILGGDILIFTDDENNQKRFTWNGTATGTRTLLEWYTETFKIYDDSGQMSEDSPIVALASNRFRLINEYFVDDDFIEHLTGGSLFTQGWDGNIRLIGYGQTTEFDTADIGRTIVGATTTDTGTILDFNATRNLVWIRSDAAGDLFDDPDEAYTIQNDPFDQVWQFEDPATFVDETTDANDIGDNDWQIFPATEGTADIVYLGYSQLFSRVIFDNLNGVQGVSSGLTTVWEYWDGTAWSSLAGVTDGTSEFTIAVADGQVLTYTVPTDWAVTSVNGSAQLYYIRLRITAGTYSTNPVYDQGFVGGVGAGAFNRHGRHGEASVTGESAWSGATSIGDREAETSAFIFQEGLDEPSGSFKENKVVATKGTQAWWPHDAALDILLKTKEADSIVGPDPATPTLGSAKFLMRQYSKTYSHFKTAALATAGGETVVPFSVGDDGDNTTGFRQITDDAANGTGTFVAEEVFGDNAVRANATKLAVITLVAGSSATPILDYYLIDDLTDFDGTEGTLTGYTSGATFQPAAPSNVGPAATPDSNVTIVFGEVAGGLDINNGNGARPYSIEIDPTGSSVPLADIFEVTKFRNRRGATVTLQGEDGEEYIGSELQVQYSSQAGGDWTEGVRVYDQTTEAEGIIVADHDDGTSGDVILKAIRGIFTDTNTLADSPDPSQQFDTPSGNGRCWTFDDSGGTFVDESVDADSAATGDVVHPGDTADIIYFGVPKPFSKLRVDIGTSGTVGAGLWEYWNGTAWTDLEAVSGFVDGTTDFTAATGFQEVTFPPPGQWTARSVNASPVLYYIRHRTTGAYTINPIFDQILVEDNVTATINGVPRAIPVVAAAPFGTFPGGSKFFGAPGVALVIGNLASGEEQLYNLIDDDGTKQVPPNTVAMTQSNLISGDQIATFRRTGSSVTKNQFTLASGNNLGDTTIVMDATIPSDNVTGANSKVRIISSSNQQHRYRIASFTSATYTLSAASTGTDGGSGGLTTINDGSATFQADNVAPGDLVRNTTDGFSFSTVVSVDSETVLTVTDNGVSWVSQAYSVNTLVENYGLQNAYASLLDRVATAATASNQLIHTTDIDVRTVVRRSTVAVQILPFSQDTTLVSTGLVVPTVRAPDGIIT